MDHFLSRRSLFVTAALAACARSTNARRTSVRRIVSVAPNTTEMLFALGLGPRVVGVSALCDFPREATVLPRVGALGSLSLEAILALRPDAVVGAPGVSNAIIDRLRARSIRVLIESVESIASVRSLARALAALCDEPRAFDRWQAQFDRDISDAERVFTPARAPRVLAVIDQRPLVCAGPGSYIDELLRRAHATNAISAGPAWPQLSIEAVLQLAPDVVIDLCGPLAQAPLSLAWNAHTSIPAVRDHRVLSVADPLVTRPGPRAPLAVTLLARALRTSFDGAP